MIIIVLFLVLTGCVAQEADLRQTEKDLQHSIKKQNAQLSQARAKQSMEISTLRDQDLPRLRGDVERAVNQAQDLQAKQDDLKFRLTSLEQHAKKMETENSTRHAWVQKSLTTQEAKVSARLNELSQAMEQATGQLRKDIVDAIQRTNDTMAKRVESRLDEQQKGTVDNQKRLEHVSEKFTQFNQALTGFREALTELNNRGEQEEQETGKRFETIGKQISARLDGQDRRLEVLGKAIEKTVELVNQRPAESGQSVGKQISARLDEQDRRLEILGKAIEKTAELVNQRSAEFSQSVGKQISARLDGQDRRLEVLGKAIEKTVELVNQRPAESSQSVGKQISARLDEQDRRLEILGKAIEKTAELVKQRRAESVQSVATPTGQPAGTTTVFSEAASSDSTMSAENVVSAYDSGSEAGTSSSTAFEPRESVESDLGRSKGEHLDQVQYERLLTLFREGDFDGARLGFTAFLSEYPNSTLAPNARYWQGESYYGKKEYEKAIESYDQVEMNYPRSEKVAAAILKKGYAYLALKDKKRASSAFKQVVTLYPKSPEAGKASNKLAQIKDGR